MITHLASILAATLASYVAGSLWYLALGAPWRAALGWDAAAPYRPRPHELAIAFFAQLAMATCLAYAMRGMAVGGAGPGALLAAAAGLGLVLPSLATNVAFQRRSAMLIAIDGGHWLVVLAVIGAVLGALS